MSPLVPHPWDKYGTPLVNSVDDDADNTAELEERAEELRDLISGMELNIEDLEDGLRDAEGELYDIEQRLRKPVTPGQTRHSEEF